MLRNADAAGSLDGLCTRCPVGARAGQDDGDGFLVLLGGERAEEVVDRPAMAAFLDRVAEPQRAELERERMARRDDIGLVGLDRHAVADFLSRVCVARRAEDFAEQTGVIG